MRDNISRDNGLLTTKEGSKVEDRQFIRPGSNMRLQSRDRDSVAILMGAAKDEEKHA